MRRGYVSWIILVVGVIACIGIAYGASLLAGYSWDQVVSYRSPYAARELGDAGPPPGKPLAKTVVLVIVDGMRDDITRTGMPSLDRLRDYGTDVVLRTAQPSLSYPNWTTILTGAPQTLSGVTTNWWEGRVPVPSLIDEALAGGRRLAVVGPSDFADLYGVEKGPAVSLRDWPEGGYLSGTLVDDALRIAKATDPELLIVHLPDLDEAGHDFGGASAEYRQVAARIDADLSRLIAQLQSEHTAFVVVADHGHIATGGHGGWEPEVIGVPLIVSGGGARLGTPSEGTLDQVASTVAVLAGMRPPAFSNGAAVRAALATDAPAVYAAETAQRIVLLDRISTVVSGQGLTRQAGSSVSSAVNAVNTSIELRKEREKEERLPYALAVLAVTVVMLAAIAAASWRAFVSALAGAVAYYASYNLLFFVVHGYKWSLSSFNTEQYLETFFTIRMIETVVAGLMGVAVAAAVYPFVRRFAQGPRTRRYLAGWLSLAPATVLVIMSTLAMQVAWFLWAYGPQVTWTLPDFKWAFKYDLDLVQMTALGAVALLGMLVSYLVGRYHPRIAGEAGYRRLNP